MAGLGGGLGGNAPHMLHLGPSGAPLPRGGGGGGGASVTLAVPEERVGLVIGKQGSVINQIKELLGVSIRISKKGEFLPGSHDRACSITGTPEVCCPAGAADARHGAPTCRCLPGLQQTQGRLLTTHLHACRRWRLPSG